MREMASESKIPSHFRIPSTRYQGSKRKLIPWIYDNVKCLRFGSALDLFGGTGVVSYLLKQMGKQVTYNDYMRFNFNIGKAIIENSSVTLGNEDIEFLLGSKETEREFISETFAGKYFTDDENLWLDRVTCNISRLSERYSGATMDYKKSIAYYGVFQSCLMKRPFNLFHRANLNLRTSIVPRRFGNKTSWETPFDSLFRRFVNEANSLVFGNGRENKAVNEDALSIEGQDYDLVYIDPPYFSENRSQSECDYERMYHFLEGLSKYDEWAELIDYGSLTFHLRKNGNRWLEKKSALGNLERLLERFSASIIMLSYKSPGVPGEDEIVRLVKNYKAEVRVEKREYRYALSKSDGNKPENIELLVIGT